MFISMISFAVTILLLVVLLHLFMYLYVSEKKVNFAILVLSACLLLLSVALLSQGFSIRNFWLCIIFTSSVPNILIMVSGGLVPWVTYQVLGIPVPLFWKRFIFVPLFLMLFLALYPDFGSDSLLLTVGLLFIIFIPSITGSILAIIKARKMKKGNIGIIAGSLLMYPLTFIIMIIISVIFTYSYFLGYIVNVIIIVMLISMPVGMSIQQAKRFLQLHLKLDFLVKERTDELSKSLNELKSTQSQLIQSEKMASLGQLTAGIAHEIQNPLNFVNNFSEVNKELIDELKEELAIGNNQSANEIADNIKENEQKINHHGKRAESIVKGMLLHSRGSSGHKEPVDINALCDEYLRLSYHGFRAKDKSFNADYRLEADKSLPKIEVVPQDIGRVLLNLINNAFYAVGAPPPPEGGIKERGTDYKPTVIVRTSSWNPPSGGRGVKIIVKDNGPGIPDSIKDKIFQPFFTTKPTGQGTGLGLSLAYDIVKVHGGEIKVESKIDEGTQFIVQLPIF
jgi:signal transduction histidine kinase